MKSASQGNAFGNVGSAFQNLRLGITKVGTSCLRLQEIATPDGEHDLKKDVSVANCAAMENAHGSTVPVALHDAECSEIESECSLYRKDDMIPIAVPVLHQVDANQVDANQVDANQVDAWFYCGIAVIIAIAVAVYHRPNVQESTRHNTPIQTIVPLFIDEPRAQAGLCPLCACRSSKSRVCTSLASMSHQAWLNFDGMCHICLQVDNKAHAVPVDEQLERGLVVVTTDSLYKVADPVMSMMGCGHRSEGHHATWNHLQKCRNTLQLSADDYFMVHGLNRAAWKYAVGTSLRNSIVDTLTRVQAYYSCDVDDNTKNFLHDRIAFWYFAFNHTHDKTGPCEPPQSNLFVTKVDMTMRAPLHY